VLKLDLTYFCAGGQVVVQLSLHIRELLLNENDMASVNLLVIWYIY